MMEWLREGIPNLHDMDLFSILALMSVRSPSCLVYLTPRIEELLKQKEAQMAKGIDGSLDSLFNAYVSLEADVSSLTTQAIVANPEDSIALKTLIEQKQKDLHKSRVEILNAMIIERLLPDGRAFLTSYPHAEDEPDTETNASFTTMISAKDQTLFETHLNHHLKRIEERVSMFRNIVTSVKTLGLENPLIQQMKAYFAIDQESINDISQEIKNFEDVAEEIRGKLAMLRPGSPKKVTEGFKEKDHKGTNTYTLAYILDGAHELRRLMDKVLDKTRDPSSFKPSLYRKQKMIARRAIPDTASLEVKLTAFREELVYTLPGGAEEYYQDMLELRQQSSEA
jgi:hypothetical protein